MAKCIKCEIDFSRAVTINGIKKYLTNRKYCLQCSPFGVHNTKKLEANNSSEGKELKCNRCNKIFFYDKNKGHSLQKCNSCNTNIKRFNAKSKALMYKGGCCVDCGYNKHFAALSFHHLDPTEKEFSISNAYTRSWESIKLELDKCIILCLNCHSIRHFNE